MASPLRWMLALGSATVGTLLAWLINVVSDGRAGWPVWVLVGVLTAGSAVLSVVADRSRDAVPGPVPTGELTLGPHPRPEDVDRLLGRLDQPGRWERLRLRPGSPVRRRVSRGAGRRRTGTEVATRPR